MHFILLSGFLLFPLYAFIRFQNFSVLSLETICLAGMLVAVAGFIVLLFRKRRWVLCAAYAVFITSLLSTNWDQKSLSDYIFAVVILIGVSILLTRFTPRQMKTVIILFLVGMIVGDFFTTKPSHSPFSVVVKSHPEKESLHRSKTLSHILYIVTDEFIGLDGMPESVSSTAAQKKKIENFFLKSGFTLFPKAYSQYPETANALSNLFNFSSLDTHKAYFGHDETDKMGLHLAQNKLFDWAKSQGDRVAVYQTSKFDFCAKVPAVDHCIEYSKSQAQAVENSGLTFWERVWVLGSQFVASHALISDLATFLVQRDILQPYTGGLKVVPMMLAQMTDDILQAQDNTFFFAYLGTPHFPYIYDNTCHVRPVKEWEHRVRYGLPGTRNTPESYERKYGLYYEQIDCLDSWLNELFVKLEQAGLYDNMTVIIHGDHGSRINLKHDPWANIASEMSTQDFLTNYAVFLAIKKPHEQTGSVNEIQGSLKNIIQAELIDHKSFSGEDEAFVYFKKKKGRTQMAKVPMVKR